MGPPVHRNTRILILLLGLLAVAGMTLGERLWVRSWTRPLQVAIYPVAADSASAGYVASLRAAEFEEIASFIAENGRQWRRNGVPVPQLMLMAPVKERPPLAGARRGLDAIRWSLRLRWFAFRHTPFWAGLGRVRIFVLYHQPRENLALPHSHALQKGLLGVVHAFADAAQREQNNFVIAHELLHTLGARDKYDTTGQPEVPAGLADMRLDPLYPQLRAEIMAGRIAMSPTRSEMPKGLGESVIGYATAAEIGW